MTLLKLKKTHEAVVIELGTNHFGEIAALSKIVKPNVAVFTNVGESHLKYLKTPLGVFREKVQLIKNMDKQGYVIFNADDKYLKAISKMKILQKRITFAINEDADFRAKQVEIKNGKIIFSVKGKRYCLKPPVWHNVYNALTAICCSYLLKIGYNGTVAKRVSAALLPHSLVRRPKRTPPRSFGNALHLHISQQPCNTINKNINKYKNYDGRLTVKKAGSITIIDDTYNSNPVSFRSAVKTLDIFKPGARKIIVCADMLELGLNSKKLH